MFKPVPWRVMLASLALGWSATGHSQESPVVENQPDPMAAAELVAETPPELPELLDSPQSILDDQFQPIDLNTALRLAGVQNPELNVARQRVLESVALRQLAAAKFLPSLNLGMNYDTHTGVLQQSNGNILSVNRSAVYIGAGANAVAAGTVNIPGVLLTGNPAVGVYAYLASRQVVAQREFNAVGVRNQVFLQVTLAYSELIRAEGQRAIALQAREEAREIARLTYTYARAGEGRPADANRAAAELAIREANVQEAEGAVLTTSARLAQIINVDTSIRLHPTDAWAVPLPIVPDPIPVAQLIAMALVQRPELASQRAAVRAALLALDSAKVLPFSPNVILGFSGGGFGGGSNLVRPFFGGFGGRSDFDAVAYWSLLNMGVGNMALINRARAEMQATHYQQIGILNRVRAEVAENYALTHARFAQIVTNEQAIQAALGAFQKDLDRVRARAVERGREVLPIELLNSFRLLAQSRSGYLDAIVDYNRAQFGLYVALGQPPANMLARPVPTNGIAPSEVTTGATEPPAPPLPENETNPFVDPRAPIEPEVNAPVSDPARAASIANRPNNVAVQPNTPGRR